MRFLPSLVAALSLLTPFAIQAQDQSIVPFVDAMGSQPCVDSEFTCVTMQLPRDHFANDPTATLPVTFAISLATDPGAGTLIYAVGGPGASGLLAAQDYVDAMDPELVARTNIVFFDQRGVGPDHGFSCVDAMVAYDAADLPLSDPDAAIATARTFVEDCLAAIPDQDLLKSVNTDQAIRDIEAFRLAIGKPKLWLYGESYGTQFVQEYATAFPNAVKGVIVDGTVDLNLGFAGFYQSYTAASENILQRVLAECDRLADCRKDMQGGALATYDALAAQLRQGPITVAFPMGTGKSEDRQLTATMLENSAFYALYGPSGRGVFLRVLAAASRGDLIPLLRLGYSDLGLNSETLTGEFDPSYSPASYYAINCSDYREFEGDAEAAGRAILAEAQAYAATNPRLLRTYYAERLGCAFWPHQGEVARPEPFAGGDYPTLVLNSDTDPITPVTQAYSVFDNVQNGHIVVMQGGPHVIYGWGLYCPDQIVADMILLGEMPATPVQLCEQPLVDAYVPLTLTDPADQADALAIARALETEMLESPEFLNWSAFGSISVGCDHGGVMYQSETDIGYGYRFTDCAMWPGIVINGEGVEVWNDIGLDRLTLTLDIAGPKSGQVTYVSRPWTESWGISGSFDGKPVETPRPMP
ncbi:MAG: alpha/beta hydrolase [Rhodobacteraceae bacterium]|nr:alpha/beta hydrolase [Paracoccaceae bacterium]